MVACIKIDMFKHFGMKYISSVLLLNVYHLFLQHFVLIILVTLQWLD